MGIKLWVYFLSTIQNKSSSDFKQSTALHLTLNGLHGSASNQGLTCLQGIYFIEQFKIFILLLRLLWGSREDLVKPVSRILRISGQVRSRTQTAESTAPRPLSSAAVLTTHLQVPLRPSLLSPRLDQGHTAS